MKKTLLFSALCLATAACQKPIETIEDLEDYTQRLVDKQGFTSLTAAIVQDDSLVWAKGFGLANKEQNIAASEHTAYLIASISKSVTAVAAMQLAEAGTIDLDADISTYLGFTLRNPGFPNDIITCRQLLSHTSSIVDAHYDEIGDQFYYYGSDPTLSLGDFCEGMLKTGGQFYNTASFADNQPGTFYDYSNLASALLGYVVEKAAGQSFDAYTQQHIFAPLGMSHTGWRLSDFDLSTVAMPYAPNGDAVGHYTFADYPNGGLRTDVTDLSKFLRMIIQKGSFNGQTILNAASVDAMLQTHYPDVQGADMQGLGLYYIYNKGVEIVGHSGGESGTTTEMYYDPQTKKGAIVFVNEEDAPAKQIESLIDVLIGF